MPGPDHPVGDHRGRAVLARRLRRRAARHPDRPRALRDGQQRRGGPFAGINVDRTKFWLFVVCGMVSALAGVFWTLRFASARADNGTGLELSVVAAVLLGGVSIFGGRGGLVGALAAVVLLGVLRNALQLAYVPANTLTIVTGALLIASVVGPNVVAMARRAPAPRRRHHRTDRSAARRWRVPDPAAPSTAIDAPHHPRPAVHRWSAPSIEGNSMTAGTHPRACRPRGARRDGLGHRRLRRRTPTTHHAERLRRHRHHQGRAEDRLPAQAGQQPYFTTSDNGGKVAVEEFKGTYSETGPSDGQPVGPGQLHQHAVPAGHRRHRRLGQRQGRHLRRAQRGPQRRRQGRHLRLRHQARLPRPVHQPGHRRGHRARSRSS